MPGVDCRWRIHRSAIWHHLRGAGHFGIGCPGMVAGFRLRWELPPSPLRLWRTGWRTGEPPAYSYPRVIHRSEESPEGSLPAASVNNSAAQKNLVMKARKISPHGEDTQRLATNTPARHSTPNSSPSRQALRWSLTNTQQRTAHRSHYKPFARIGQRVFANL